MALGVSCGDWESDRIDESVSKITNDVQVRRYGKFLEEYAVQLQDIEDALDECVTGAWDFSLDPIALELLPRELTTLFLLISTENKLLNKTVTALAAACVEIAQLKSETETKFYDALLFYGEGEPVNGFQEGDAQVYTGRLIGLLQDLLSFANRCSDVTKNVLQQLSSLHGNHKGSSKVIDVTDIHLVPVYQQLAELLGVLITLDEIIANQTMLKENWTAYKRIIKAVQPNPGQFGVTIEKLQPFEKILLRIESNLLDGRIFQNCVEQNFDEPTVIVSKNSILHEEFLHNIRTCFTLLEPKIGDPNETNQRQKMIGIFGLYALHFAIFRSVDKKMFKSMWDLHKKVPATQLIGNILWFPDHFLVSKMPHMAKVLDSRAQNGVVVNRHNYLQAKGQNLQRDAQNMYLQVSLWMVKMESAIVEQKKLEGELNKQCTLYMQGISLAYGIQNIVSTVMNLHVRHHKAMAKSSVLALCRLIELLKAVEFTYHRHSMMIAEYINHLIQHLSFLAIAIINTAKGRLSADKKYNERRLDAISALDLAERALNGPGTKDRRLVAHIALCFGTHMKVFRDEEIQNLQSALAKLDTVCELQERVHTACNCSFFYWHRIVFPVYLADMLENPSDAPRIHYMFGALKDCVGPLLATRHESSPKKVLQVFEEEIQAQLKEHLLDPLCRAIETDLRLHIHAHFQLDDRNPFRVGLKDLSPFLRLRPFRFLNKMINPKAYVERYIEKTFYNLTTVALHDWRTYGKMRNLASQKYGLLTINDHLPSQTLEQGLDVLEIMRNIHVFVVKYLYNLNNQIFVEKFSNNKHLNTINIRHIANSIRTHGSGIMNTTVNFTYQFLRKKFYIFSQFMYDEHIKSRLIKDLRYFKEIRAQNDQKYPYDRAEKFSRGIRKLGLTADGQSYLDQFRQLISQIGNAMGYVRMIRSGGLHYCYNAVRFIPDLEDVIGFEESCKSENLSNECQEAAQRVDSVISNLLKSFEGTEYFKLLVDVFAPVFRDSKNIHLRNFHIIVPPLCLNFVEHSIACKDSLNRKSKQEAAFTDDGFAMGVAYILKLLDLDHEFDSLHWFQSVGGKYKDDQILQKKQRESITGKEDEKLQQTMALTAKRLETWQREFELLYYSLSSARIFFRSETVSPDDDSVNTTTKSKEADEN